MNNLFYGIILLLGISIGAILILLVFHKILKHFVLGWNEGDM